MVLAVKLQDDIFIPQSVIDSGLHLLGLNYSLAQNNIKGLFSTNNESKFKRFSTDILKNFEVNFMFNLYHLVDSLSISELLIANNLHNNTVRVSNPNPLPELLLPIENYLNYLGFIINDFPSEKQFIILNTLKRFKFISEYWIEGETKQIKTSHEVERNDVFDDTIPIGVGLPSFVQTHINPFQLELPENPDVLKENYLSNLNFENLENRGEGATIIIIEANATNDKDKIGKKVNISHFQKHPESFDSFGEMSGGNLHQLMTLITLYGNKEGQIVGLVPNANLVVCSLRHIPGFELENFINRKNNLLSLLRENLFKILKRNTENAILLLEFETIIPLGPDLNLESENFPSFIIYDICKRLGEITTQHNTIVVGGVGNLSKDFNNLDPIPWKLEKPTGKLKDLKNKGFTYVDLTQKNLPFIMVSAVDKKTGDNDFTIEEEANYGKEMDVYMYTDFPMGTEIVNFNGTSAASAATAGIIAFLQGKALSGIVGNGDSPSSISPKKRKLTLQIIKKVFESTFMSDFPRNIQTSLLHEKTGFIRKTTLKTLWENCEMELKKQSLQRQ
jgi:hypothetical protein